MITAEDIAAAKARTRYWGYTAAEFAARRSAERCAPPVHEHDDCIRIAYEWLDAQRKTKTPRWPRHYALKHLIERWAGRYVSQNDVEVAAELHPEIRGVYPSYNIGTRLVWPSEARLVGISEAMKHPNYREGLNDTELEQIYGNRREPAAAPGFGIGR
jgi:hypothetical protein